jgi:hypothetical protein
MSTDRQPLRSGRETRRLTVARALAEVRVYRPGPALAAAIALAPGALALAGAVMSLAVSQAIPVFLPVLLLLWVPALPATWLAMVSVRTSATGIAAARPWRKWEELPWELIERAERHGIRYALTTSDGRRIVFAPATLREGARLRREILVRLPPQVLDERLRSAARDLLGEPLAPQLKGGLSAEVRARPRARWRKGAVGGAIGGGLAVVGGALAAPATPGLVMGGMGLLVLVAFVGGLWWLNQEVILTKNGIQVIYAPLGGTRTLAWGEIQLVEHTRGERMLRLRGERRLRCAGPRLLSPADRDAMRAFLHTYCVDKGVPIAERRWLW